MYLQHTTNTTGHPTPPLMTVRADTRGVAVVWGQGADVYMSLSFEEAERLRDGLSAALATAQERAA